MTAVLVTRITRSIFAFLDTKEKNSPCAEGGQRHTTSHEEQELVEGYALLSRNWLQAGLKLFRKLGFLEVLTNEDPA